MTARRAAAVARAGLTLFLLCASPILAGAEILVRWDQDTVPPRQTLGLDSLVIPLANRPAIESARAAGYRVFAELDEASAAGALPSGLAGVVVRTAASGARLSRLRGRAGASAVRVLVLDARGKWPHIRTNWVTKRNDVLQVASRSAQPWIENNAALIRLAARREESSAPIFTYRWTPLTPADTDRGPALEDYLVAVAEAGTFGGDLLLPLHPRFERELLLGLPDARRDWAAIRTSIDFHSSNLTSVYTPVADIAVVTSEPMRWFELLNLLGRHNLAYAVLRPGELAARDLQAFKLLLVLDGPAGTLFPAVGQFAAHGGTALVRMAPADQAEAPWRRGPAGAASDSRATYAVGEGQVVEILADPADPNAFALQMRQRLTRAGRAVDIWNGITVMVGVYQDTATGTLLVTAINYAHEALPIQMRIAGTYDLVHYEAPGEPARRLAFEHRDGHTEFVVPALRVGARIFLSRHP